MARAKRKSTGAPAWVVTFADLMTLLMCFFVLLFSMSQLDAQKYQTIANAMGSAFGSKLAESAPIQNQPISPGAGVINFLPAPSSQTAPQTETADPTLEQNKEPRPTPQTDIQTEKTYEALTDALVLEEELGLIEIQQQGHNVVIRFQDTVAFPAGSEGISPKFVPILRNIAQALGEVPGQLIVSGHTDNRPIATQRFRSNWDLSTARAVSVVHYLIESANIDASRVTAQGYAETRPLTNNETEEGRSKNRRVEITVQTEPSKLTTTQPPTS